MPVIRKYLLFYYFGKNDVRDVKRRVVAYMDRLFNVALNHSLSINQCKSKMILFGSSIDSPAYNDFVSQMNIVIDGQSIKLVTASKNWGC